MLPFLSYDNFFAKISPNYTKMEILHFWVLRAYLFINQAQNLHGSGILLWETLLLFVNRPKNNSNFEL